MITIRNKKCLAGIFSPDILLEKQGGYMTYHRLENSIIESTDIPILKAFNVKDIDEYENFKNIDKIKGFVFDAQEP